MTCNTWESSISLLIDLWCRYFSSIWSFSKVFIIILRSLILERKHLALLKVWTSFINCWIKQMEKQTWPSRQQKLPMVEAAKQAWNLSKHQPQQNGSPLKNWTHWPNKANVSFLTSTLGFQTSKIKLSPSKSSSISWFFVPWRNTWTLATNNSPKLT